MKRSSTMLTRLALALLALAGFAAPAAERELDGVVQTSRAGRAAVANEAPAAEVLGHTVLSAIAVRPAWTPKTAKAERGERRYLLHRAWLL